MFNEEKLRIYHMLRTTPGRISLTSDLWNSITTDGYMCVTAHFITKDWVLQKRVINFVSMHHHTIVKLCQKNFIICCVGGELRIKCFQ